MSTSAPMPDSGGPTQTPLEHAAVQTDDHLTSSEAFGTGEEDAGSAPFAY
jgi:hypothetical protein